MKNFTRLVKLLSVIVVCLCSGFLNAQVGYMDTAYYRGRGVDFKCTGGLVQPDSSVIIIGRFAFVHQRYINCIAKLTPEGEMDYSFNPGKGADEHINVVVRQPDGKLVIGGDFRKFNDSTVNHIARLNPDGSRDLSFVTGTGFTVAGTIYAMHLQSDGKILLGGNFTNYNGTAVSNIVRLNANGTVDNTFSIGTGFNSTVYSIDQQPDGRIIVAGNFVSFNGDTTVKRVVRLNTNGTRDMSFVTQYGANNIVTSANVLPNGKIIMAGFFTLYDSVSANRIVRLNVDGSRDVTFDVGTGFNNNVNELAIQPDGKILATGGFTQYKGTSSTRIARIDSTGTRDAGFYVGTGLNLSANSVFMGMNDNIYIGGTFIQVDSFKRLRLVRLLPTGKVDHSFMRESKLNQQVLAIGKQSDNKVILGGQFNRYNGEMANRIARLNSNGTVDASFASGIGANNIIRSIVVLPDDKILIAGDFTTYNGVARTRIARLNANGSLDTSFVVGTGANASIYKLLVNADGTIYISGSFTTYGGVARARIAKINASGSLNTDFLPGTGFNSGIAIDMAVQPNGNIVVGGSFTSFAGTATGRLARILPTGTIDATFNTAAAGANNAVNAIYIQGDGKIIIGGTFTTFNSVTKSRIARLNADGSLDVAFNAVCNNAVSDIASVNGKILVSGTFTQTNSVLRNRISSLYMDGTNDTSFFTGTGFDNVATNLFVDNDSRRVYVGGTFSALQGRLSVFHAAVKTTALDLLDVPGPLCHGAITYAHFLKNATYNSGNGFIVQLSDSTGKFTNPLTIGSGFNNTAGFDSIELLIPNNIPYSNNYYVRIVASDMLDTSNVFGPVVIQQPEVPVVSAGGPTAICPGETVILTSSPSASYLWNSGDTTQSIIADSTMNYIVTTSRYNCSASSGPIAVSTNNVPDSAIVATAGSFCNGGSIMLTASANNFYSWSTGDTTQSITVTQSGTYTLLIRSAANCYADSTVVIDFNSVGNYLIVENGPTTFCQGGAVTLTSIPNATYVWSTGATTQSIIVSQAGTYRVTVTDANNCSLASNNKVITVNPAPNSTITPSGPTTFCEGGSVTLSAANGLVYSWNDSSTTQSITVTASGFFNVTVTDANTSCSATSSTTSVNVNSNPSVTYNMQQDTICNNGSPVQLTGATPAGGVFSGTGVSGTTFNPSGQSGNISITYTYTNNNNCSAQVTDVVFVDICTGIEEATADMINMYPNPATNTLNIAIGDMDVKRVLITDLTGQIVMDEVPQSGTDIISLNVSQLAAGTYLISVGEARSRFIKAN